MYKQNYSNKVNKSHVGFCIKFAKWASDKVNNLEDFREKSKYETRSLEEKEFIDEYIRGVLDVRIKKEDIPECLN